MGYQESLVVARFPTTINALMKAYQKAKATDFYSNPCTSIPINVVVFKQPIGEMSAGTKAIWAIGDRCFHRASTLFGGNTGVLSCKFIPIERVFSPGDEKLRGIELDSSVMTSNEFLTCYPIDDYAKKLERNHER